MVLSVAENQEIGHVGQESTDSRCRSRTYQFIGRMGGEHGIVAAAGFMLKHENMNANPSTTLALMAMNACARDSSETSPART